MQDADRIQTLFRPYFHFLPFVLLITVSYEKFAGIFPLLRKEGERSGEPDCGFCRASAANQAFILRLSLPDEMPITKKRNRIECRKQYKLKQLKRNLSPLAQKIKRGKLIFLDFLHSYFVYCYLAIVNMKMQFSMFGISYTADAVLAPCRTGRGSEHFACG